MPFRIVHSIEEALPVCYFEKGGHLDFPAGKSAGLRDEVDHVHRGRAGEDRDVSDELRQDAPEGPHVHRRPNPTELDLHRHLAKVGNYR